MDAFGTRGRGGEKNLGRRAMRIFLEEVMLDLPDLIEAELVGKDDLLHRLLVLAQFRLARPRLLHRMFVENSEFHGRCSLNSAFAGSDKIPIPPFLRRNTRRRRGRAESQSVSHI